MAHSVLLDIGLNDKPEDVIRKTNDNFRRISRQAIQQARAVSSQNEGSIDDATQNALGSITSELNNAIAAIESAEKKAEDKLDEAVAKLDGKIEELNKLLASIETTQADFISMFAELINGATVDEENNLTLPEGTMIATGDLNIIYGERAIRSHSEDDDLDLTVDNGGGTIEP